MSTVFTMWTDGKPGSFTVANESETIDVSLPDPAREGEHSNHKKELAAALKIIRSLKHRVLTVLPPRPYYPDDGRVCGEIYLIITEPIATKRKRAKKQSVSPMYALDAEEIKSAHAWIQKHGQLCGKVTMGALAYEPEPGAIGTTLKIVCPCGEKGDITDYGSW